MGGKSSKKQEVKNDIWKDIPTSGHSIPRSPTSASGRGTSTSPSEAWERGSDNGRDQHEWFNSTNSSYNLLDLQVFLNNFLSFFLIEKRGSLQYYTSIKTHF